ncbi:hypothetical protein RHSIM_Rhsim02G0149900 [Rhododendron simsii]|uniref:Uncharacterized protein n=1 Tax=Rhododendron simsii TaxID=118357 RepID=A0A834HCE5_RHOSS|nr:hypothetical protein RHSIM_Rhsim02G0149900 [Rhododendron simsii]
MAAAVAIYLPKTFEEPKGSSPTAKRSSSQPVISLELSQDSKIAATQPFNTDQNEKQKAAVQIVTQVENGIPKADCDQPKQVSISNLIVHSTGEEISDSEDELLEVLEGVVSSKQEVEAPSQPKAAVSLVKAHSELETSPTPEPPDLLDLGVKGVAAVLNSNGGTVFSKHLSKSTKKRLRKQAKEASVSSFSSGRN